MKSLKVLLVFALIISIIGIALFATAFIISGFSFDKMTGITTSYNTFSEKDGVASKLVVSFDTWDVHVKFVENAEKISVVYPERTAKNGDKLTDVSFAEADGTISVIEKNKFNAQLFLWDFTTERVDVTIPKDRAIELFIETDTADVIFDGDAALSSLSVETDTGDINAKKSTLKISGPINLEADTGDISLGKTEATLLAIETNSGDVELGECIFSANADISVDTGSIDFEGSFVCNSLKLEADTGDIEGKAAIDANNIEIETDTGDVELILTGKRSEYEMLVKTHTGDSNIISQPGSPKSLSVKTDTGDIQIFFTEE